MNEPTETMNELAELNRLYRKPFAPEVLLKRKHVKCYAAAVIEHRRRKDIAKRRNAVRGRLMSLVGRI